MAPAGLLSLTGLEATTLFLRGLLDRWRVRPTVIAREEYKNFANTFTETGFTPAHRDNMMGVLSCTADVLNQRIAAQRGLALPAVQDAVDAAPLLPADAARRGLVDGVLFRDQVQDAAAGASPAGAGAGAGAGTATTAASSTPRLQHQPQAKLKRVSIQRYIEAVEAKEEAASRTLASYLMMPSNPLAGGGSDVASDSGGGGASVAASSPSSSSAAAAKKPHVALVYAVGTIVQGPVPPGGGPPGGGGGSSVDACRLVRSLRKLREDPSVKAVVVRVSSPGGSAVASDAIYRELRRLRESGRPVVVSMGDVAASGGYLISMAASRVIAQPSTVTGSIGVIIGK